MATAHLSSSGSAQPNRVTPPLPDGAKAEEI
jgi:hypothetical protein